MKCIILLALVVFLAQEAVMLSGPPPPCPAISCSTQYDPVCGKKKVGDCWEVKIFQNDCAMALENDCHNPTWLPCVENQCGKE